MGSPIRSNGLGCRACSSSAEWRPDRILEGRQCSSRYPRPVRASLARTVSLRSCPPGTACLRGRFDTARCPSGPGQRHTSQAGSWSRRRFPRGRRCRNRIRSARSSPVGSTCPVGTAQSSAGWIGPAGRCHRRTCLGRTQTDSSRLCAVASGEARRLRAGIRARHDQASGGWHLRVGGQRQGWRGRSDKRT